MSPSPQRPWYREPMVWLVIALPLSSVLIGSNLARIAIRDGSQVLPEPLRQVQKYQVAELERDRVAQSLGLQAHATLDTETGAVTLRIEGKHAQSAKLQLKLWHSTLVAQDQGIDLILGNDGTYLGRLTPVPRLAMHLMLEPVDQSWLLRGDLAAGGDHFELLPRPVLTRSDG